MNLYVLLRDALQKEPSFVSVTGKLNINIILKSAQKGEVKLLALLLDDALLKVNFFLKVKEALIFNQFFFTQYLIQQQSLEPLAVDKDQRDEITLQWPFKNFILGNGKHKDKPTEIFLDRDLAKDAIAKLLSPKVLTNAKYYGSKESDMPISFNRNQHGTITDNLVIKGDNLVVLHSLKEQFAQKIKLIYIDPPYNTGGLSTNFHYHNSFKRSSWLTFMYNRLRVAKELLSENGMLIIAIDKNEQPYLGVLLKEFFTNYDVHCITIVHNPRGVQGKNFSYTHEYAFFVVPKGKKLVGHQMINQEEVQWTGLRNWGGASLRGNARNCFFPIIIDPKTGEIEGFGEVCEKDFHPDQRAIKVGNQIYIYPIDGNGVERKWRYARQTIASMHTFLRARMISGQWDIELGKNFGQYKTVWAGPKYDANEYGTKLLKKLLPNVKFSFPKSLHTVMDCIYAAVGEDKEAIILDYHAGSGTTAHAVMQLNKQDGGNRKFILCEQMDYIHEVTIPRIVEVMKQYKQGEFIYFELKKYNANLVQQVANAIDCAQLLPIYLFIKIESVLLNPDFNQTDEGLDDFKQLNFEEQKLRLRKWLHEQELYVDFEKEDIKNKQVTIKEQLISVDFYDK